MIAGSLSRSFLRFQNDQALCMNWTTNGHIWGCTPCLLAVKGMQLKTKLSLVGIIDCRQQDIVQQIKWNYQVGEKEEEGHATHVVSILCVQKRSKSWTMKTFPFGISVSTILYTKLLKTRKKKTQTPTQHQSWHPENWPWWRGSIRKPKNWTIHRSNLILPCYEQRWRSQATRRRWRKVPGKGAISKRTSPQDGPS